MNEPRSSPSLWAISDLHVEVPENRAFAASLAPEHDDDWLILCGDVGEMMADVEWALGHLSQAFATVVWVPGNHELWTHRDDPVQLRGEARYQHLVARCRELGVLTPEDPYPTWDGHVVAPLFLLYDYSLGTEPTKAASLERAHEVGVVCTDEFLLHPDPYGSVEDWCDDRLRVSLERLDAQTAASPTVLVNHWPLHPALTKPLLHPEFAQWCGTKRTAGWHERFRAAAVVFGHLHIPRTTVLDGVPFEEVSFGYPRERARRGDGRPALRRVLPRP